LTLLALGAATVATAACGKKVDCDKFCAREAECITEISVTLGVASPQRVQSFTEAEVKLLGDKQKDRCMKSCSDESKPKEIDAKWNACLEKPDCQSFSQCVYAKD
jgi:hypothetical protein